MADTQQTDVAEDGTRSPEREHITVTPAQVAAAKLQLSIDRKFGHKSLGIIKLIAAAK